MKRSFLFLLFLLFSISPVFSVSSPSVNIVSVEAVQQVVYMTNTESKYHKNTCKYLRQSKIKTIKSKAQKAGYTACEVCKL